MKDIYIYICYIYILPQWIISNDKVSIWVFPKIGGFPPKWMVKIMENPINPWMIWGDVSHYFSKKAIYQYERC